jgi:hypothetical protein
MIYRPTLLWTKNGEHKSVFFLCEKKDNPHNGEEACPYSIYKLYAQHLMDSSVKVNGIKSNALLNQKQLITDGERHYNIWKDIIEKRWENVSLHRLYRNQLVASLHSTWDSIFASYSKNIHWTDEEIAEEQYFVSSNNKIGTANSLYNSGNLLNDKTQKLLLPYTKKTENLLDKIIKKYDRKGCAKIFPSADIGFPNNIQRLAGGFATGLLVVWKCGTPFVPVDTTVNVCSSSILHLDSAMFRNKKLPDVFSEEIIHSIIEDSSQKAGYAFSFNSGNHFLMFCKSKERGGFYLVMHSSAKEFKDSYMGLYPPNKKPLPLKNNWYSSQIHEYQDEQYKKRYIRYLIDGDAKHFIELAKSLNKQNEEIHTWIFDQFIKELKLENKVEHPKIINHYEMPTDYSVAIGTYVMEKSRFEKDSNYSVPIFTRNGNPIALFRPNMEKMHTVKLAGEERFIIPHGWGQCMPELEAEENALPESVYFQIEESDKKELILNIKDEQTDALYKKIDLKKESNADKYSLSKKLRVRNLFSELLETKNISEISKDDFKGIMPNYLQGDITDILVPLAIYSKDTCKQDKIGIHYFYTDEDGNESYIDSKDERNNYRNINIAGIKFGK